MRTSIAAAVYKAIEQAPTGQIFGYERIPQFRESPGAVVKAMSRAVASGRLTRVAKGRFYKPRTSSLGDIPVGDTDRLHDLVYRDGQRSGYITGCALYNRLGLTTQVPKTIKVAVNRASQPIKDFGTIRIKLLSRRAPISESTVPLLEILDVLSAARRIPATGAGFVLRVMPKRLAELTPAEQEELQHLALSYYRPRAVALLGMLLTRCGANVLPALKASLNPNTRFKLGTNRADWPESRVWNFR